MQARELPDPTQMDASTSSPEAHAQAGGEEGTVEQPEERYRVYPGRFYVLVAFALLAGQQALSWMTFGTIPNESFKHFGLTDDDVTLLSCTLIPVHTHCILYTHIGVIMLS